MGRKAMDGDMGLVTQEFAADMSSLASHAAIELDNFILNKGENLESVRLLEQAISVFIAHADKPAPISLLDPGAVVLMHRAIDDSVVSTPLTTVSELAEEAGKVRLGLKEVVERAKQIKEREPEVLVTMRKFCLALSRRAAAQDRSLEDLERTHPFRR